MNDKKKNSEREKGAAPPDYMPAIFGWLTQEEQMEIARELIEYTKGKRN